MAQNKNVKVPETIVKSRIQLVSPAVDTSLPVDTTSLKGANILITGGASGIGEALVRRYAELGAYVTFGDINQPVGQALASSLGPSVTFVACDVTVWSQQLTLFKAAAERGPIDHVIANAGINEAPYFVGGSSAEENGDPVEPNLKTVEVNITSVLYTTKLAFHYSRKAKTLAPGRDRSLVLVGSLASYYELAGGPQYTLAKHAVFGLMKSLRHTSGVDGLRVNMIAPWFVDTQILATPVRSLLLGLPYAKLEDVIAATILLTAFPAINGRSICITPEGYSDMHPDSDPSMEDRTLKTFGTRSVVGFHFAVAMKERIRWWRDFARLVGAGKFVGVLGVFGAICTAVVMKWFR
ncbi:hypothetical protein G7K_4771-t1 [Saitoella complicata NRRL Y-17804]|uniref:NAD(P)-binding protein n=2 Tax=Saitoella complicata (strain BCRC 22490 / CBS 7301 / JCM 7358 / NBRC 10748 / NRRL Y-17804) TaxID=698492 RepID=A0A0E9NLH4_SAICN|nr:hypothetical protein G7K_4771-t1 [Saitoella complicata NRRL Y-17804]